MAGGGGGPAWGGLDGTARAAGGCGTCAVQVGHHAEVRHASRLGHLAAARSCSPGPSRRPAAPCPCPAPGTCARCALTTSQTTRTCASSSATCSCARVSGGGAAAALPPPPPLLDGCAPPLLLSCGCSAALPARPSVQLACARCSVPTRPPSLPPAPQASPGIMCSTGLSSSTRSSRTAGPAARAQPTAPMAAPPRSSARTRATPRLRCAGWACSETPGAACLAWLPRAARRACAAEAHTLRSQPACPSLRQPALFIRAAQCGSRAAAVVSRQPPPHIKSRRDMERPSSSAVAAAWEPHQQRPPPPPAQRSAQRARARAVASGRASG